MPLDFTSFHDATFCDFTPCPTPTREPDFVSPSRSVYWDTGDGVVRCADHWGQVASCVWLHGGIRWDGDPVTGWAAYRAFGTIVPATIERDRAVLVAPGSATPLAGRTISIVIPLGAGPRGIRAGRWSVDRLRRGRSETPRRRPPRAGPANAEPSDQARPPGGSRTVVTVIAETAYVIETACGRRLPRRSAGAAWFVDGREASDRSARDRRANNEP